ncbi:MAG: hypothetical protein AB7F91_06105 [Parvularculaceae bacterium]
MSRHLLKISAVAILSAMLAACGTTSSPPPAPPPPPPPAPGFVGDINDFYAALAQRESGGNAGVENTFGYLGLYQMGEPAMMDATWYDETAPNETSRNDWIGAWLSRAQAQGVTSKASYLAKPAAQDVAVRRYHSRVAGYISALGLLDYEGQTVNGIVITRSGLLAACHLLGCGTVRDYLESPGGGTPADAYGTTIEEYLSLFANYETAF